MPSDANSYPLVNFHYAVSFLIKDDELNFLPGNERSTFEQLKEPMKGEIGFQSVSGLNVELQTESIKEGGENRFEHVIPVRSKYSDLVLKRAVVRNSSVIKWVRSAIENLIVLPIELQIKLFSVKFDSNRRQEDIQHEPIVIWTVHHAWPKKWSFSDLNAEQGEVFIETLELNYNHFEVEYPGS